MDERFHDNPLVTGEPGIRFYAGCPLTVPNGSKLGTLCLIDIKPRGLDEEDRALLHDLARMAGRNWRPCNWPRSIELTLLSNRRGFEALSQHALNVCKRMNRPASLLFFDLNDFKPINDTYGHAEGDRALMSFAEVLRDALRESDVIGRLGGDEFVALLTDSDIAETPAVTQRLQEQLAAHNAAAQCGYEIRFSVGQIEYDPQHHDRLPNCSPRLMPRVRLQAGVEGAGGTARLWLAARACAAGRLATLPRAIPGILRPSPPVRARSFRTCAP